MNSAQWLPIAPVKAQGKIEGSIVLYEGPSMLTGDPIVVIVTGLKAGSKNSKTGDLPQVWIIRQDLDPYQAQQTGLDVAVCGSCVLRPVNSDRRKKLGIDRACYVDTVKSVGSIFKAYTRDRYNTIADLEDPADLVDMIGDRRVRLGAYGDPMAWPLTTADLHDGCDGIAILEFLKLAGFPITTGYSHQWKRIHDRKLADRWARIVMASCDTRSDHDMAIDRGFTPAMLDTGDRPSGSVLCPAQSTNGRVSCATCTDGTGSALCSGGGSRSVLFEVHGTRT